MTLAYTFAGIGTALAVAFTPMAPALAQEAEPAPAPAPAPAETQVSDEMLDSFVMAALNVSEIVDEYRTRIDAADTDSARQGLAEEAQAAMIAAVEQTDGITIEEYVTIGEAASADADLNERIVGRMQTMQEAE